MATRAGFRAVAVLLWWAAETDPRRELVNLGGIGLAAAESDAACVAWAVDEAAASTRSRRFRGDSAFLAPGHPDGQPAVDGRLVASDEGFVLELDGEATRQWHVRYLALGGDVRGAAVRRVELDAGTTAVSGLGFRPDLLVFLPEPGREATFGLGIGVASSPDAQAAAGVEARVVSEGTLARGALRGDAVLAVPRPDDSGEYAAVGRLVSVDADGFTLSCELDGSLTVSVLALHGGVYDVGVASAPARSGGRTKIVGPHPAAALLFTTGLDVMERIRDIARLAIGVVAGDDAGSVTWSMRRWDGPPEPRARATAGHALEVLDTESGELHAQSVFDGFDRGALRLRWPIADRSGRDLVYVTVGLAEQTTGQPRLRLWQHFTRHLHGSARAPGRGM